MKTDKNYKDYLGFKRKLKYSIILDFILIMFLGISTIFSVGLTLVNAFFAIFKGLFDFYSIALNIMFFVCFIISVNLIKIWLKYNEKI